MGEGMSGTQQKRCFVQNRKWVIWEERKWQKTGFWLKSGTENKQKNN